MEFPFPFLSRYLCLVAISLLFLPHCTLCSRSPLLKHHPGSPSLWGKGIQSGISLRGCAQFVAHFLPLRAVLEQVISLTTITFGACSTTSASTLLPAPVLPPPPARFLRLLIHDVDLPGGRPSSSCLYIVDTRLLRCWVSLTVLPLPLIPICGPEQVKAQCHRDGSLQVIPDMGSHVLLNLRGQAGQEGRKCFLWGHTREFILQLPEPRHIPRNPPGLGKAVELFPCLLLMSDGFK